MQVQRDYSRAEIGFKYCPALDIEQFQTSTMGDRGLQEEVSSLFVAQLLAAEEQMRSPKMTAEELKFLSHTLRGAALAIGATEIAALTECWDELDFVNSTIQQQLSVAHQKFQAELDGFFNKT